MPDSRISQRTGQPSFTGSAGTGDGHILPPDDPATFDQIQHMGLVELAFLRPSTKILAIFRRDGNSIRLITMYPDPWRKPAMDIENSTPADVSFVLVYFNANAYDPEQLVLDLKEMPSGEYEKTKKIMSYLLEKRRLGAREFRSATAATARDDASARRFLGDVYKYAFEGGAMPDIADYWSR